MSIKKGKIFYISLFILTSIFISIVNIKVYAVGNGLVDVFRFKNSDELNSKIEEAKEYGVNIKILMTEDLKGWTIETVADDIYHNFLDDDTNAIIFFSTKDRKIRVHTGKEIQELMPNYITDKMVKDIVPYFREENYDEGLQVAMDTYLSEAKVPNKIANELMRIEEQKANFKRFLLLSIISILGIIVIIFIRDYHIYHINLRRDDYNKEKLKEISLEKPSEISKNAYRIDIKLLSKIDKINRIPLRKTLLFFKSPDLYIYSCSYGDDEPIPHNHVSDIIIHNQIYDSAHSSSYDSGCGDYGGDCGGSTGSW